MACTNPVAALAALRPHDLLWVADASDVIPLDVMPAWATAPWLRVAPVVVRRAPCLPGDLVPVGLRGATRSERCAAHVVASRVLRATTPEEIGSRVLRHPQVRASRLACLRTLARIAPMLDETTLRWGVTGSVGFTLASGFDVLRADSDLDLLVRAPRRADADALRAMDPLLRDNDARIDLQIETPCGAFAWKEWLRTGGPVLLKTAAGPVLCDDLWLGHALSA